MKFVLTRELGKLATWLRILGFDALYMREEKAASVMIQALKDERIIVTRNRRLPLGRGLKIIVLRQEQIRMQLKELFAQLEIEPSAKNMFTRCVICNQILEPIQKQSVEDRVPDYVYQTQERFYCCPACNRVYWQGTHWGNVEKTLQEIWNS